MAFNGVNFEFNIAPEELDEKGQEILKICSVMREYLEEIETSMNSLDSWKSVNKIKFEDKIRRALVRMYELVEVIESYGGVARQTSRRIISTENRITSVINGE